MQIRSYDRSQKKWLNHFINSKRQRWTVTESRWIDGEMVTLNAKVYSNAEPHMTREIDSEISANRFVKRIRRSEDLGVSAHCLYKWVKSQPSQIDQRDEELLAAKREVLRSGPQGHDVQEVRVSRAQGRAGATFVTSFGGAGRVRAASP